MAIKHVYNIIQPQADTVSMSDNADDYGFGMYNSQSWYNRIVQGSANRLIKYQEYDIMDNDVDVARSLDIIAEEMTGNNPKTRDPLLVNIIDAPEQQIQPSTVVTLKAALRTWVKVQEWDKRLFDLCRVLIKYGDCFFLKGDDEYTKVKFLHSKNVLAAVVSQDNVNDVRQWMIRLDHDDAMANLGGMTGYTSAIPAAESITKIEKDEVMRFTLSDEMSSEAPFGVSILRPVYSTYKQKELLEDAILIYRIQRAPERRVFYVDVGKMHPQKVKAVLTNMKDELKQKKIPASSNAGDQIDSRYNPQSMSEDIFLPQRADGSGTKVDVLQGGKGLGELSDLEYFYKKMWRAMRIPNSYMSNMPEDGATDNNGRVGIAYMQEIKFSLYIQRLQTYVERTMDKQFKQYVYSLGISIDPTIYNIVLPEPSDYAQSRQQSIDGEAMNLYSSSSGSDEISKRFAMKRYLGLSEEEIRINEYMKAQELGLNPDSGENYLAQIYSPEQAEQGGFEGGLGGMSSYSKSKPSSPPKSKGEDLDMPDKDGGGIGNSEGNTPPDANQNSGGGNQEAQPPTDNPGSNNMPDTTDNP